MFPVQHEQSVQINDNLTIKPEINSTEMSQRRRDEKRLNTIEEHKVDIGFRNHNYNLTPTGNSAQHYGRKGGGGGVCGEC